MEPLKISLKKQFYFVTLGIVFLIVSITFSYNIFTAYQYNVKTFIQETYLEASLLADNIVEPMLFLDKNAIKTKLLLFGQSNDVVSIEVYNKKNELVVSYKPFNKKVFIIRAKKESEPLFYNENGISSPFNSSYFAFKHPIVRNSVTYGYVIFTRSTEGLNRLFHQAIENALLFLLILLLLTILITIKMANVFVNPIVELSEKIIQISRANDYKVKLKYNARNEIGKLYHSFNALFESIHLHQTQLENLTNQLEEKVQQRTQELQNSLETLKKTQKQLIESEKMASLGSLVSGVAHEINTPLGNALTGSTVVHSDAKTLLQMIQNNTLKKSTLELTLTDIEKTSSLVVNSISRAATLVKSFKQISVDQSLEAIREFDIRAYLDEILLTFKSKLKKADVTVNIKAPDTIKLKSYPGVFAQIFNNLIQNSLLHGFEDMHEGAEIEIDLSIQDKKLSIRYKDNGRGISPALIDKVFDPFVTTKRNAGGTGLGLNILYNLVTQKLQGEIHLASTENQGVVFTIIVPVSL